MVTRTRYNLHVVIHRIYPIYIAYMGISMHIFRTCNPGARQAAGFHQLFVNKRPMLRSNDWRVRQLSSQWPCERCKFTRISIVTELGSGIRRQICERTRIQLPVRHKTYMLLKAACRETGIDMIAFQDYISSRQWPEQIH